MGSHARPWRLFPEPCGTRSGSTCTNHCHPRAAPPASRTSVIPPLRRGLLASANRATLRGLETFDESELFRAIADSGARVLIIGRRAMIMLGLPVMTADYELWIAADDADMLNAGLEPLGFVANRTPEAALANGRYVLEDGEHIDV